MLVCAATLCVPLASTHAAEKFTLGYVTTLSGPGADTGLEMRDGAELALRHLNGKIGDVATTVVYGDDQGKSDVAREVVNKFIKLDHVDAIAGMEFSNVVLAVARLAAQAHTPLIGSVAGPSELAGRGCSKYFFNISWQNDAFSEAMGTYLRESKIKDAYLMAPNYSAGHDFLNGFKRTFHGKIDGEAYTPPSQLDYSVELARLRNSAPSSVFAFYPSQLGIKFIKQYADAGLKGKIPLYTIFTIDGTTLSAIGSDAEGMETMVNWGPELDSPQNKRFVADFEAKYGRTPTQYAANAYDSIMLIDSAVRAVDGNVKDREAFRKAIRAANFNSVRGKFKFNNNQYPIEDVYLARAEPKDRGGMKLSLVKRVIADYKDPYAPQCPLGQ